MSKFIAVLAAAASLMLAACGAETAEDDTPAANVGQFSGPWAAEFADMYNEATSDFARNILKDSAITEAERAESESKYLECLAEHDIHGEFTGHGSHSVDINPKYSEAQQDKIVRSCSDSSGEFTVLALYHWIKRNPENLDESTIMAQCLVHKGVAEKGYTAKDYAKDLERGTVPGDGGGAHHDCNFDPLDILD